MGTLGECVCVQELDSADIQSELFGHSAHVSWSSIRFSRWIEWSVDLVLLWNYIDMRSKSSGIVGAIQYLQMILRSL